MDNEINVMLDELIEDSIRDASALESGTKERSMAIDDLNKIYRLRIDETKLLIEHEDRMDSREKEHEFKTLEYNTNYILKEREMLASVKDADTRERECAVKEAQLKEEQIDRWVKIGIEIFDISIPLIVYCVLYTVGLTFEETGIVTSPTVKNFIRFFKPSKK